MLPDFRVEASPIRAKPRRVDVHSVNPKPVFSSDPLMQSCRSHPYALHSYRGLRHQLSMEFFLTGS